MKSKPIRLTPNSYAVLALLHQCREATSYELKGLIEVSIQNFWPVPRTTAYEEPARLAAAGYLSARQEEGGRRRRVYELTDAGREALAEWAADPELAPPQFRDEAVLKMFAGGDPAQLLGQRISWHRAKLAELEGTLAGVRENEGLGRSERTVMVGVAYERKMLEMLESFAQPAEG